MKPREEEFLRAGVCVPLAACTSAAAGTFSDSWSLSQLPFPPRRPAPPGPRMQNVINIVKGKALEVAEYLTPVLKVSRAGLAGGCQAHAQVCRRRGPGSAGVSVLCARERSREVGDTGKGAAPTCGPGSCSEGSPAPGVTAERRSERTRVAPRPSELGASAYVGLRGSPKPRVFENVKPTIGSRLNFLDKDFAYLFKK